MAVSKQTRLDVEASVASGLAPFELRFTQVNHCYSKTPIAYRTITAVNSALLGTLVPETYRPLTDETDQGIRAAREGVLLALDALKKFDDAGRHVKWISVSCPVAWLRKDGLYEEIKAMIAAAGLEDPSRLCLEFPSALLSEASGASFETVRRSILDMKLLHVRTMMTGCGKKDSPTGALLDLPVEMVLLDPTVTAYIGSRDYPSLFSSLSTYLESMGVEIYADGVRDDEQITILNRADAGGYQTAKDYTGRTAAGGDRISLNEAIAQVEDEE